MMIDTTTMPSPTIPLRRWCCWYWRGGGWQFVDTDDWREATHWLRTQLGRDPSTPCFLVEQGRVYVSAPPG